MKHIKWKNTLLNVICLLLLFHFFYEGVYKLLDRAWFGSWIRGLPHLRNIAGTLQYAVPLTEIGICVLLLVIPVRSLVLSLIFWLLLLVIMNYVYAFTTDVIFVQPYHTYWKDPEWLQVITFNLALAAFVLTGMILQKNTAHRIAKKFFDQRRGSLSPDNQAKEKPKTF